MTFIADQLMVKLAKDLQIRAAGETVTHAEEWKWRSAGVQAKALAELHHRRSRVLYHLALSELVGPDATPLPPSSRAVEREWPSERTTADRPVGWSLPFFTFHLLSAAATRNATSPPYGWWSPSFHLSPFTFHRVPTWVVNALPPITTR